jgi:ribonuclease P protein component
VKRVAHPLQISVLPNELPHWRLGLSIGRRLGGAVQRNTIKRLLREAFRLSQHDLPMGVGTEGAAFGYDVVIAMRPHEAITLDRCRALFVQLANEAHAEWTRRLGADLRPTPRDAKESP